MSGKNGSMDELVILEDVNQDSRVSEGNDSNDDSLIIEFESLKVNTANPQDDSDEFYDAKNMDEKYFWSCMADLSIFDVCKETFEEQESNCKVTFEDSGDFKYWFAVSGKAVKLGTPIGPDLNPTFFASENSFIYNYSFGNVTLSYMLRFKTKAAFKLFKEEWAKTYWLALNKKPWEDVSQEDQRYVLASSVVIEDELDKIIDNESDRPREESDEESSEDDEEYAKLMVSSESFQENTAQKKQSQGNKSLSVAAKGNRLYVARDDKIGVFKSSTDDGETELNFITSINNVKSLKGKNLDPQTPMLYMEDTSLIFKDEDNLNKLYKIDLNRGSVVEEWGLGDKQIVQYGPTKKFDQLTAEQTFLGISNNSIFKVDPRLNTRDKIVQEECKDYAVKNKFASVATTAQGYVAVGTQKGEIKLYDRLGIRAKTSIPSLGQPIRYLCISADGKYLLATCDSQLLLTELTISTGKNAGNIGFLKSLPASENVKTHILRMRPQNASYMVTYMKKPIKFSNAYFNTGPDQKEHTIVTSTGPFAITWSLEKVLNNHEFSYTIKRYNSDIVEDNFQFGTDKQVVVTLKNEIAMANLKMFKQPTKKTLLSDFNLKEFYGQ